MAATNRANGFSDSEIERMKMCGQLFERKTHVNRQIVNEFFVREPCLYKQIVYKNAARIFNCLKADLNENLILKSLKQQRVKENSAETSYENGVTEVPRINYETSQEKRRTLQLAFSTLKFQKVLEDLLDICQFYGIYPEFKDEQSLVCTVLFDYMMRKFQLRDKLIEEPLDNQDELLTQIETSLHREKTDLAAELAKSRIKSDALTLEELLPTELREVEQHKAELPLYCWINPLKANASELIESLVRDDELKLVELKKNLDRKCFLVDPHCPNVLMFHYALRDRILNHEFSKSYKLVVQDKSSCLAPHTVIKLLTKRDEVIVTNISGGLVGAFIGSMMEEYEGKVYIYGLANDDKYEEISHKMQQIGCSKYVKLMREDFLSTNMDDMSKLENAKVILINAPCTKTALMNPMEFLFQEGEDVKFLRDYTLDANNPNKLKKCLQNESALLSHALRFNKVRAIVYQTYSSNSSENEQTVARCIAEFNETRKNTIFPYKISPPVIPLTAEDIQNNEVVKDFKYLQFKPSNRMNGCFVATLCRDRDGAVSKEARRAEALVEKKTAKLKLSAPQPTTFQEKNFLQDETFSLVQSKAGKMSLPSNKKLTSMRRQSFGDGLSKSTRRAAPLEDAFSSPSEQQEIKQAEQPRGSLSKAAATRSSTTQQPQQADIKSKIIMSGGRAVGATATTMIESTAQNGATRSTTSAALEHRLSQIGKLDKRLNFASPNRSSTPDDHKHAASATAAANSK